MALLRTSTSAAVAVLSKRDAHLSGRAKRELGDRTSNRIGVGFCCRGLLCPGNLGQRLACTPNSVLKP